MISVKEGNFGTFEKFMEARSLESKESSMIVGKLKSIAGTLFGIVMGISIIAVFLASLVLIQYAQLMMTKNAYEIKTLLRIGYTPKSIIAAIINYFIKVFAVITLLSASSFILLKIQIDGIMMKGGIMISSSYTILSFSSVIIAFVIYTLVNYLNAKKEILRAR